MKRLVASIIFIALLGFSAVACSCMGTLSIRESKKSSDVAFVGKVIGIENVGETQVEADGTEVFWTWGRSFTFEVSRIYKGRTKSSVITIYSGIGGPDCGQYFESGKEYIVYAYEVNDDRMKGVSTPYFYTSFCARNRPLTPSELNGLGKGRKPTPAL